MTVLIGVQCSDGIVIGADSIATSTAGHNPLLHLQSNEKITIHEQNVISAATGSVGYTQRLNYQIDLAIKGNVFKNLDPMACFSNISSRFIKDLNSSHALDFSQQGVGFGALIATIIKGRPYLVEFDVTRFQPEIREKNLFFVSMGSGQILADPFLAFVNKVMWKNSMPTVDQAKFGIYWALDHTIRLAPGGVGGPIRLATITSNSSSSWTAAEVQDTQAASEYVSELEAHIGQFAGKSLATSVPTPPPIVA